MLQKWYAVHYRLRPHRSRFDTLHLYGQPDLPRAEASGSRRTSRTDFGVARWLSDGPFDPPNRAVSRSGITCRRTGTGDSAALTPCLGSRLPSAPVREGPIGWWDKSFVPPPSYCGQPGDPRDGSGRPARAQQRPGPSRRGASCAMRTTYSLGLTWAERGRGPAEPKLNALPASCFRASTIL